MDGLNALAEKIEAAMEIMTDFGEMFKDLTSELTLTIATTNDLLKEGGLSGASGNKFSSNNNGDNSDVTKNGSGAKYNPKDIGKAMLDFAQAIPKVFTGLSKFKKENTEPFLDFMQKTVDIMTFKGKFKTAKPLTDMYTAFGNMFKYMGESIGDMAKGLFLFGTIGKIGQKTFLAFLETLSNSPFLKSESIKNAESKGKAFSHVAKGVKSFAIGMAISTPLLIIGLPGFLIMMGMLWGMNRIMINMQLTNFTKVSAGMILMAGAFAVVSLSFLLMKLLEPSDILKGLVLLGGLAAVTYVIGQAKEQTLTGCVILLAAAASIIGVAYAFKMLSSIKTENLGLISVAIMSTLIAPVIVLGSMGSVSWTGVALVGAIGLSYIALSYSLKTMSEIPAEKLGKVAATVGGVIAVVVGLSFVAPLVAIGAATMAAMGVGLLSLGFGLKQFENLSISPTIADDITNIIKGTSDAFWELGGPIDTPMIISGATTAIFMGGALVSLGKGLKEFSNLNLDYDKVGKGIGSMITSLTEPFKTIGQGGFFFNDVETGVEAIDGLGENIFNLSKGVQEFANLKFKNRDGKLITINDADMVTAGNNIGKMISAIAMPLAELGRGAKGGGLIENLVRGVNGFFFNDVETGVEAIDGLGENIFNIAKAVQEFSTLKFSDGKGGFIDLTKPGKSITVDGKTVVGRSAMEQVGYNIGAMVYAIASPLAKLAGDSFSFAGFSLNKGVVQSGVESIKGLGAEVLNVVNSVKAFDDAAKKIDMDKAKKFIMKSMSAVVSPIASMIAAGYDFDDIGEGAGAIETISKTLKPIMDSVSVVNELMTNDKNFGANVLKGFTAVVSGFNSFTKIDNRLDKLNTSNLKDLSEIMNTLGQIDPNKFAKTATSVDKIGGALNKMLLSLSAVTGDKLDKIHSLMESIVKLEEKSEEHIEKKINLITKSVDSINKIKDTSGSNVSASSVNSSGNSGGGVKDAIIEELRAQNDKLTTFMESMMNVLNSMNMQMATVAMNTGGTQKVEVVNQGVAR